MFASWSDAWTALAVVVVINVVITLWMRAREQRLVLPAGGEVLAHDLEESPGQIRDLRAEIIGQQREDARRRRRVWMILGVATAICQASPVNGYVAGAIFLALWAFIDAISRAWGKLSTGLALDDKATTKMSLTEELKFMLGMAFAPAVDNPLRGRWRPLGVATAPLSIGLALVGWIAVLSSFGADLRDVGNPLGRLIGSAFPIALAAAGAATILLARAPLELARRFALARPRLTDQYDIVFLRSFKDDQLSIRTGVNSHGIVDPLTLRRRHRYERLIVAALQDIGRVVALGEPGERVPPLGAFRVYYEHGDWQPAVERMLHSARFLVLSLGDTPSVAWEITKVKELGLLDRAIFMIPPVRDQSRRHRLDLLAEKLEIEPRLLEGSRPGLVYLAVMFEGGQPVPIVSAAYDSTSYYAAVLEAGIPLFQVPDDNPAGSGPA